MARKMAAGHAEPAWVDGTGIRCHAQQTDVEYQVRSAAQRSLNDMASTWLTPGEIR